MNLDIATSNVMEIYRSFDTKNHKKINLIRRDYVVYKPIPEDWLYMMDEDEEFYEEFQRDYNDIKALEHDEFTSKVIEYAYLNMEVAPPRDGEFPWYAKVKKNFCDDNGIPFGTANETLLWY